MVAFDLLQIRFRPRDLGVRAVDGFLIAALFDDEQDLILFHETAFVEQNLVQIARDLRLDVDAVDRLDRRDVFFDGRGVFQNRVGRDDIRHAAAEPVILRGRQTGFQPPARRDARQQNAQLKQDFSFA